MSGDMPTTIMTENGTFQKLEQIFQRVIPSPTVENLTELHETLKIIPKPSLQKLHLYVYAPIEVLLLDRVLSSEVKCCLVSILKTLLSLIKVTELAFFVCSYRLLFSQICNVKDTSQLSVAGVSEEMKLTVIRCVKELFISAFSDVKLAFYSTKYYPAIAWGVMFCRQIAEKERMITLRVEALECILYLTQCNDEADQCDIVFKDEVRKVVAKIMPGIVSAAAHACKNLLEHHRIVQMGIRVWSRIVVLVMEDIHSSENSCDFNIGQKQEKKLIIKFEKAKNKLEGVHNSQDETNVMSKEWFQKAATNLAKVSEVMVLCQQHDHYRVRKELSIAMDQILSHCSCNMDLSISSLTDCLIVLCEDENEEISMYSKAALSKFSERYKSDSEKPFLETVENSFYLFLTRFPGSILSTDVTIQMKLLNGYLSLLGSRLPQFLSSKPHLTRLIYCIICAIEVDVSSISVLADPSTRDIESREVYNIEWKKNILSHGQDTLVHLEQICSVLRKHISISIITHSLLDSIDEYQKNINELLLILNSLLTDGEYGSMKEHVNLLKEVLQFYLELPIWPASEIISSSKSASIRDDQTRVVQLCLAVEGIGKMANAVGKEVFNTWLLLCLYPVLEAAGSSLGVVSVTGLEAVKKIADVCSEGDLTVLICNNVDYLTHHITRRLQHYHSHPSLLAVLSVIMNYSSVEVLPSLHEIVSDILQQSYDFFQMSNMFSYLQTFFTFIKCVKRWSNETDDVIDVVALDDQIDQNPLDVLFDYIKSKDRVENMDSDSDNEDYDLTVEERLDQALTGCERTNDETQCYEEDAETKNEPKKNVPTHIQLVVDILQRSLHFLPSKDPSQRILVLQVLEQGILLLKAYPDELLPVVHSIWAPLVNRFQTETNEPLVMNRAFLLLQAMASTSRNFIRMRTLRDILPSICKFLKEKSNESILKDTKSAYRLTQQYKLQHCLLEGLGQLAVDVEFSEINVFEIINSATPYLSSYQPQPLQNACINLFMILLRTRTFRDLLWLHLLTIWSPAAVLEPPSSLLPSVQLCMSQDSEFKKNIQVLLPTNS